LKWLTSLLFPFTASVLVAVWFEASMIRGAVIGIEEQAAYAELLQRRGFAALMLALAFQVAGAFVIRAVEGWGPQATRVQQGSPTRELRAFFPAFLVSLSLTALCFFLIIVPSDRTSWFETIRALSVRWLDKL
jgi:hypothetical protein